MFQFANRSTAAKIPSRDKGLVFVFWENKRNYHFWKSDARPTARSTKHLREAARSAKREASANEQQALVKCAGLWAEERKVFWGFYFEEIFHGFEGQKRSFK